MNKWCKKPRNPLLVDKAPWTLKMNFSSTQFSRKMTVAFDNPNPHSTQLCNILSGKFIYKPLTLQTYIYGCPSFLLYVAVNENTAFKKMLLGVIKSDVIQQRWLNNKCHIFFVRQCHLLSLPQAVVDGEGINGDGEMFRVDLREAFTSRIVSEN